jgi:hypothetical protein
VLVPHRGGRFRTPMFLGERKSFAEWPSAALMSRYPASI